MALFSELADPLLQGDFPTRSLNQAVAVAAMCLQEDASVRPLISDVVTALSFLGVGPATGLASPISASSPPSDHDRMTETTKNHQSQVSANERQRAVAEAIEWGSNSRGHKHISVASIGSSV
ncbi:unnamed protein product [Ilex paraguariensis]|uniref:Uncharacterized protein n=1 Tax=Ilex paraguariensis TaxID=185542 RepID=A0ABC8SZA4_9AQUA